MSNLKKYESEIKSRIGEKRFLHTLRVAETAVELAEIHGIDSEKAKIAGLLHDCAKIKDINLLKLEAKKYDLLLTQDMMRAPQIIHSHLGAILANRLYGIDDEDILNAIAYHTTGRPNMSELEKIIFLADYIEPKRNFPGVEKARELARENLDKAMYFALNNTLKFLVEEDNFIATETVHARNFYWEMNNWKLFLNLFSLL